MSVISSLFQHITLSVIRYCDFLIIHHWLQLLSVCACVCVGGLARVTHTHTHTYISMYVL